LKIQVINKPDDYFIWLEKDILSQLIITKSEIPELIHLFSLQKKNMKQN